MGFAGKGKGKGKGGKGKGGKGGGKQRPPAAVRRKPGGGKGKDGGKGKGVRHATFGSRGPRGSRRGVGNVDDISMDSDGYDGYEVDGDDVDPDDDESIPDDEAFDSEDEKRWGDLFGGSKKGKKKGGEEEEQEEDKGEAGSSFGPDDDSDDDSRILSTDEEIMPSDSESEAEGANDVDLNELIDDSKAAKKKKSAWKGGAQIIQETAVEGGQAQTSQTGGLTLEELIAGTADSGASLKRVQKKLHRLQEGAGARIDLPEHKKLTAAREREITREQVEKDLKRWEPTVRANKKAEFQVFPLPDAAPPAKPTTSKLALETKAENDMEREIAGLLEDSGLRKESKEGNIDPSNFMKLENDVVGYAGENEADFEDKQGVAAKLKSVLYYEHQKRRHMKRIKSKTYRRMMRKELEKQKEKKLELLATIDPEAALQKRKDELLKARAQERMGMRHKNKSQWIKHVKHMAKWDPSVREAMGNQSQIHRKLMQKMDESAEVAGGYQSDDESSGGSEESKQIDTLLTPGGDKSALWNLRKDIKESDPKKGIWSMKFMKRAAEKEKKDMLKEVDEIERNVDAFHGEEPAGGNGEAQAEDPTQSAPAVGKVKFGGQGETKLLPAPKHQDENAGGILKRKRKEVRFAPDGSGERSLTADTELTQVVQKERSLRRDAKRKRAEEEAKQQEERTEEEPKRRKKKGKKREEEEAESSPPPAAADSSPPLAKKRRKRKADAAGEVLETADGVTLDQDFLIGRAFAADTLAEEFAREKDAAIDKDVAPLDPQLALPGWGEWGGKDEKLGQRQKKKWREMEDERKGLVQKAKARRADAALNNVIINEDEDVLDEKYRLKKLPYPFENEKQLASTLATPLGPDWNTETRTQLNIRPKYVAKAGKIIAPIELQQGTRKVQRTKTRRGKRKAGDDSD
eukprot:Hpha_TRINITY_DN4878_c0_g1::TRINITY_DN4878_c0_g1_i1::g.20344::m.20344/K14567/UTP14; U3 small nucleolar RNA-associated protein 14